MYQMKTFETGGIIRTENRATRVLNWFQFEALHDFRKASEHLERPKNEFVGENGLHLRQNEGKDYAVFRLGYTSNLHEKPKN